MRTYTAQYQNDYTVSTSKCHAYRSCIGAGSCAPRAHLGWCNLVLAFRQGRQPSFKSCLFGFDSGRDVGSAIFISSWCIWYPKVASISSALYYYYCYGSYCMLIAKGYGAGFEMNACGECVRSSLQRHNVCLNTECLFP